MSATADAVIAAGLAEVGKPYVFAEEGPDAFDCSGLMQWAFGRVGLKLPRTAAQQQKFATPIDKPQPGDLVFWGNPATHVAMYLGDGKILSAPKPGAKVHVTSIYGQPTYGRVPGLISGPVGAVITPVAGVLGGLTSGVVDALGRVGLTVLIAGAGALLVGLGGWQLSKGGNDA